MKKLVPISVTVTLFTLVLVLLYTLYLERNINRVVLVLPQTLSSIQSIETNTTRTEAELSGLLNTTRHIAIAEQKAQDDQLHTVQLLETKTYMVLDDTDLTVKQIGALAPILADSIQTTTQDVHVDLDRGQHLMEAATDDLSSPSIHITLDNMEKASENFVQVTHNTIGVTQDMHEETNMLVSKTRDAMKPENKAKSILKFFISSTLTGAELFYYLSH